MYGTFSESPEHKEAIYGDSKLPDHHQEDQETQGHPPSRINETLKDTCSFVYYLLLTFHILVKVYLISVTVHLIGNVEYIVFVSISILNMMKDT